MGKFSSYYPEGAENDPNAPWNQLDDEDMEFAGSQLAEKDMWIERQWEAAIEERLITENSEENIGDI